MSYLLLIGLFLPLIGFLLLLLFSYRFKKSLTSWFACATVLFSFFCFCGILYGQTQINQTPINLSLFNWIPVQGIDADFKLHLDHLSLLMALIVTGISFLIHVYSIGYMDHEEDDARYFACLNFFVFAMLLLVLAGNLLLLFVGWEGVGLASYLLIGFWYHRPAAAKAATKAFVVNRIGDTGLLVGLLLTFHLFGTSDIEQISERVNTGFTVDPSILTLLTFLYFWGAIGKSAQLPLYTWLPDAMEGPTPVSALIHAATMVTAGVYLVVRMHPIFMLAPETLQWIGNIGGLTALFAALCAVGQMDLKRVLAYSTISQLGFMFLACGVGAFYAAMFHLTTHAFIKALLFLSAGNVVHMMNGATNMEKMGGLAKKLPKTNVLFLIGVLALSGIPPLAAFFSKELILEQEYETGHYILFYVGLAASILTAFYLTRAYYLTFMGPPRLDNKILKTVREAPRIMWIPVSILGFLSIVGGFLGFPLFHEHPILENFLEDVGGVLPPVGFHLTFETTIALIGTFLGLGLAAFIYTRFANRLGPPIPLLKHAFYINEIYQAIIVKPLEKLSQWISQFFEPKVFDHSIRFIVQKTQQISHQFQRLQSGEIRSYFAWMIMGATLLIVYFIL